MKISVTLYKTPKKGEDPNLRQVIFRVREGNNDLKVRTDLMADPTIWDDSIPGYRRTTKLGKGGTKAFNDRLQDIFRLIEADFTPMRDGKWLKEIINGYLHPEEKKEEKFSPLPCEDKEKDTTLEHLDEGSVPAWFMKYAEVSDVCHGRKQSYYSTIKKIRRYELYKREFERIEGFNLIPDTLTIDDLYDFYDCLTYLFWHWPMYAFSYCWLSKYFRRFCFLVAFFVMILEFCLIVLLSVDNRSYHHDRMKYNIVRNWSYVLEDSAAMNRFNKVDLLFQNVEFNREKIMDIGNMIQTKNDELQKKRRKW